VTVADAVAVTVGGVGVGDFGRDGVGDRDGDAAADAGADAFATGGALGGAARSMKVTSRVGSSWLATTRAG
jgi:hypothetical protein